MNPILTKQRVEFYTDLTSNARFNFAEIALAVNDATEEYIDEQMGDELNRDPRNYQWIQKISDNLYTLVKTTAPTVTAGTVITNKYYSAQPMTFPFPADYKTFVSLSCIINSYTVYGKPTTYNQIGPLLENSFKKPTNEKVYFNSGTPATGGAFGMTLYRGTGGTFSSCSFTYIKNQVDFSIGSETNLINAGTVLTNAVTYYAVEISVYNAVTYQIGATITGNGNALTSGQVIPVASTVAIELPAHTHEVISKMAATKLLASIGQFDSSQAIQAEANKSV